MPEEGINPIELPGCVLHVWRWFIELDGCRPHSEIGSAPLSNGEILAYFTLEGYLPESWELGALRALDSSFIEARRAA